MMNVVDFASEPSASSYVCSPIVSVPVMVSVRINVEKTSAGKVTSAAPLSTPKLSVIRRPPVATEGGLEHLRRLSASLAVLLIVAGVALTRQNKFDADCIAFWGRIPGDRAQFRIDSTQFAMQKWRGRHCHRITALMIGGTIAHHAQHVVQRQNAGGSGSSARLFSCAIARALLSSTRFASTSHSV